MGRPVAISLSFIFPLITSFTEFHCQNSCRHASPGPFQPVLAGVHVDCCVFKGCNWADQSKWAVRLQHGHLVPSQYPGKFPSLILTGKREPPFPPKNVAPRHLRNHALLVMQSIFRTGEVDVIWLDHQVWAIILMEGNLPKPGSPYF
jgi:hypothetical protein